VTLETEVSKLVSDSAGCDHAGCRCWQAVADLKAIRDYCDGEIQKSRYADLKEVK
jgi:hypothetical protein